jgi:ankyrin repeat protein
MAAVPGINTPVDASRNTQLILAVMNNDLDEVNRLLAIEGIQVNKANLIQETPLYIACENGYTEIVARLLQDADIQVNKTATLHTTPLHIAAANGHLGVVELLLQVPGIQVNTLTNNGLAPIHVALQNRHFDIVNALLRVEGVDVNIQMYDGRTPLHIASEEGYLDIVDQLLGMEGIDVNAQDDSGATPLHTAVYGGDIDVVQRLLATPDIHVNAMIEGEEEDITAIDIALGNGRYDIAELLQEALDREFEEYNTAAPPTFKGWSKQDVEFFDQVLDTNAPEGGRPPAENWSVCPVCLAFVERREGCMYMAHTCTSIHPYFHQSLYNIFKRPDGKIEWCTLCGRVCKDHRHYELASIMDIRDGHVPNIHVPVEAPEGLYFGGERECIKSGGGGYKEKIARMRRMREYASLLLNDVGKKTYKNAWKELVEAAWDAPVSMSPNNVQKIERILATKTWNIPSNVFPANVRPTNDEVAAPAAPSVPYPFAGRPTMNPILGEGGMNNVSLEDVPVLIQLRHRQEDGTVIEHPQKLSIQSLFNALTDTINPASEYFGKCIYHADGCTGLMYPDELQFILDAYPTMHLPADAPERGAYQRLIDGYRLRFNTRYRDNPEFKARVDANSAAAAAMPVGGAGAAAGHGGGRRKTRRRRQHKRRRLTRQRKISRLFMV